jgi:hypothetical protein
MREGVPCAAATSLKCAPQEFAVEVENFAPLVKSSTLFNKANAGFLRDAIPIAEFTKPCVVKSVRLVRQRKGLNDGQFRSADEIIDIEVTEVSIRSVPRRGHSCGLGRGSRLGLAL